VLSYRGNIWADSFFNELNAHGIVMAGIKVWQQQVAFQNMDLVI
jgi:hypothetical protein